jgi:hypothetical protein
MAQPFSQTHKVVYWGSDPGGSHEPFSHPERRLAVLSPNRLYLLISGLLLILPPVDPSAERVHPPRNLNTAYSAETTRWRSDAGGFAAWQRDGVALAANGALQLDPQKARAGTDPYGPGKYLGGNFYNGGSFIVGEATGPAVTPGFPFSEATPSWNADTPAGTWIEVQVRAMLGTRWTAWYNLGVWAGGAQTVARHSVSGQADADAYVDVDTLKLGKPGAPLIASGFQLKLRLFGHAGDSLPNVRNAAVAVSTMPAAPASLTPGNPALWGKLLHVPECSQMVYPNGGEVWCSPTSVAMVLGYWQGLQSSSCDLSVHSAVTGVYDRVYGGHGNWPFNTAYAAGPGMEAFVSRFTSLSQAEPWIAAGVPVIMSVAWTRNQLTGAPIPSSNGHLMVLAGFDPRGNPILNDPAAASNGAVQRTYSRAELERLWLQNSGGTVYLIYPAGRAVPKI